MESATHPERIEFLTAVTRTDSLALSQTEGSARLIVDPPEGRSSAVRNWNCLARIATGSLLFVIADDLFPRAIGWDVELARIAERFDPVRVPYVLKIDDASAEHDTKLRHPVVSRKFYSKYGLWNPEYSGVFVDSDLTLFAFWNAAIIDCRHISFDHRNPINDNEIKKSLSYTKANSVSESIHGRAIFERRWPKFLQGTRISLIDINAKNIFMSSCRLKIREAVSFFGRSRLANLLRSLDQ